MENQPEIEELDYSDVFGVEQFFPDKDSLVDWVREEGRKHYMVMIILKSYKPSDHQYGKVVLVCEKFGRRKSVKMDDIDPSNRRRSKSKKRDCKFKIVGDEVQRSNGVVPTKWKITVVHGSHNHDILPSLEGHSFAGRLTSEQMQKVRTCSASGVKPVKILDMLRKEYPSNVTSTQQIYNARYKLKVEDRSGRTITQQALHFLGERNYYTDYRTLPGTNIISDLILSHHMSRHWLSMFPYVLVMDTTYKTNRLVSNSTFFNVNVCNLFFNLIHIFI